jgi:hypothetical protein
MTIYNGEVVLASDLNNLFDGYISALSVDNETRQNDVRVIWTGFLSEPKTINWVAGDDFEIVGFGTGGDNASTSVISNSIVGLGVEYSHEATVSSGSWNARASRGNNLRFFKGADYTIALSSSAGGLNTLWAIVRLQKRKI